MTSSSTIAERPRDALFLSVIFNSTIHQSQSSIIGYFGFRFTAAYNCSLLFSAVIHAGCDKQDSLMCGGLCVKRTSTLTAIQYCTAWSTAEVVDRTPCGICHRSDSQIKNCDFCLLHLHSTPSLGAAQSEYCHNVW